MARVRFWAWLSCLAGVRPIVKYQLLEAFGGPERVFRASEKQLSRLPEIRPREMERLLDRDMRLAERALAVCEEKQISILTLQDAQYPDRLRNIPDPPVVLYVWGRLPAVDDYLTVAVVGTRNPSAYGERMAAVLGGELAAGGAIVVSGLADGCDGIAMDAALRAGSDTVGVLGTPIDRVYPAKNRWLFELVKVHGALVSEYAPGVTTYGQSFRERNRIISGLSLGVAVAEAPMKSGTRITVDHALEQGRDVFAVPGNTDAAASAGCNDLISRGALMARSGEDILSVYSERSDLRPYRTAARENAPDAPLPPKPPKQPKPPKPQRTTPIKKEIDKPKDIVYIDLSEADKTLTDEQRALLSALTGPSMHADELAEATGLSARQVMTNLTTLLVSGYVMKNGQRFTRIK